MISINYQGLPLTMEENCSDLNQITSSTSDEKFIPLPISKYKNNISYWVPFMKIREVDLAVLVNVLGRFDEHVIGGLDISHGRGVRVIVQEPEADGNIISASCRSQSSPNY